MPTSKEFLKFLDEVPQTRYRAMMGEYVVYYRDKVIGGVYDNRLLVKPCEGLHKLVPEAQLQIPYAGAKPMVLIENYKKEFLTDIFETVYAEIPQPKPKKK